MSHDPAWLYDDETWAGEDDYADTEWDIRTSSLTANAYEAGQPSGGPASSGPG